MKSLKTQFIAAIAMVLVAAVAMGSSTFAWFSLNTQVKAEHVDITVKTAETLAIAADASDAWKTNNNYGTLFATSSPAGDANGVVEPVVVTSASHAATLSAESVAGTAQTSVEFYTLTAENQPTKVDNALTGVTTIAAANAGTFANFYETAAATNYASNHFHIAYFAESNQTKNLKVTINVTKTADNVDLDSVDGALHVGLLVKYGATTKFYNYDMSSGTASGLTISYAPATAIVTLQGINDAATTADQAKIADITAYVWYEGEDAQCYTLAALSPKTMTVDLQFDAVAVA